jgi:mannitol-specific phosphotransferase system IIBC component
MTTVNGTKVSTIIIACDAGMGSSAMLASRMSQKLAAQKVTVKHAAINQIPEQVDLVMCHEGLAARARSIRPGVPVVPFRLFIGDPVFDKVIAAVRDGKDIVG